MNKLFRFIVFISVIIVSITITTISKNVFSSDSFFVQSRKYTQAFIQVIKFYVDEVNPVKLTESAIVGMLEALDPHSAYLPPKTVKSENERFRGNFEGIGVEFNIVKDTLLVVAPLFGGPSEKVGVRAGDKIIMIDDSSAVNITKDEVFKRLKGPKGTKVTITVIRKSAKEPLKFVIIRDKIPHSSIASIKMLDKKTGYIFITSFIATTHREFVESIQLLKSLGMKRLILDLRGNRGGYLEQAIKVSDELLSQGKQIVYTKGRATPKESAYATAGGTFETQPLVILINNGSASASEIVSGAVQDNDRGIIAGLTSFGKGLVQRPFELSDGSQIRLTISKYYTPSGRSIQREYDKGKDGRDKYYKDAIQESIPSEDSAKKMFLKIRKPIKSDAFIVQDTSHPKFKTLKGRIVLGSGGITPDYFIFPDTASRYVIDLLNKAGAVSFSEFALSYLDKNPKLRKLNVSGAKKIDAQKAFAKFDREFNVTNLMIKNFFKSIEKSGVVYNKEKVKQNDEFLKNQVKAYIARNIWGSHAYWGVLVTADSMIEQSQRLFREAQKYARNYK